MPLAIGSRFATAEDFEPESVVVAGHLDLQILSPTLRDARCGLRRSGTALPVQAMFLLALDVPVGSRKDARRLLAVAEMPRQ